MAETKTRNTEDVLGRPLEVYRAAEMAFHNAIGTCFADAQEEFECAEDAFRGVRRLADEVDALERAIRTWMHRAEGALPPVEFTDA